MKVTLWICFLTSIGATRTVWYAFETILWWSVTAEQFSKSMKRFSFLFCLLPWYFDPYMVRNHKDGYPYLNLLQKLFLTIYRHLHFFGKIGWSINSGRRRAGNHSRHFKQSYSLSTLYKTCVQIRDNLQNLTLSRILVLKIIPNLEC